MKAELVEFEGLKLAVPPDVYPPAEDSSLLLNAVRQSARGVFLDLGCASGAAGIAAAQMPAVEKVFFADINPSALAAARSNAKSNGVGKKCSFVKSDLFSAFAKTRQKFDCISFNPPYLPTTEAEKLEGGLNLAYDGGPTGRDTLDRFISQFPKYLSAKGVLLLVSSSLAASRGDGSGNDETLRKLGKSGFRARIVGSKGFFFEQIAVIEATRKD